LYVSETGTLRSNDIKRLEELEMLIWRHMEKISWTEHMTYEQVLLMVAEQRSLMDTIQERQFIDFICHMLTSQIKVYKRGLNATASMPQPAPQIRLNPSTTEHVTNFYID